MDGEGRDGERALRKRAKRRVDLFLDLAQAQQGFRVRMQAARNNVGIDHFENGPTVMLVIILEAEQQHDGGPKTWSVKKSAGSVMPRLRTPGQSGRPLFPVVRSQP